MNGLPFACSASRQLRVRLPKENAMLSCEPFDREYDHTQTSLLDDWHFVIAGAGAVAVWSSTHELPAAWALLAFAVEVALVGLCFGRLTKGDCLAIRYWPLPVFRKLIRYDEITSAESGRSAIIDGWVIHFIPGRG